MAKEFPELSKRDSSALLKRLLKKRTKTANVIRTVGNLVLTEYHAKNDKLPFDARPLFLVLRSGTTHTLGLNFHWLPVNMRIKLLQAIVKSNKRNIQHNNPLNFTYKDLKPFLRRFNYAPCVRLYLNTNFAPKCVQVPAQHIIDVARMDTAVFTGIKANDAYKLAWYKSKRKLKRR